ncbi:hypothetical protein ZEAMMB73_Zm00001d044911 [Zea mays]|uniref:Uncharacterized protein n=1 Tax=Zea mays TaxID=4577 RepID=A0A1D6NS83_MAIZE|nr:hypothetical protein ZEAMMB73_Zm00001d044911 [Zea mays]
MFPLQLTCLHAAFNNLGSMDVFMQIQPNTELCLLLMFILLHSEHLIPF